MNQPTKPAVMLVYSEINKLRTNPAKYADTLKKYLDWFEGKILKIPDRPQGVKTQEGKAAFQEAIEWLKTQKPVDPITPSAMLTQIAEDYRDQILVTDMDKIGDIEIEPLIEKRGSYEGSFSRAIEFGGQSHQEVIVNLIVSDGDKSRQQRPALMGDSLKRCGCAVGTHKLFGNITVITAATKMANKNGAED